MNVSSDNPDAALTFYTDASGDPFSDPGYSFKLASFVMAILSIVVSIFGFISNVFVVRIFGKKPSSINILLVGLACFDNWLLLTSTPLFSTLALYSFFTWSMNSAVVGFLTLYVYPLAMTAQTASAWTMVLISVDRYLAVCRPFQAIVLSTPQRAKVGLATTLALALLYNGCRFFEYRHEPGSAFWDFASEDFLRDDPTYRRVYVHWMYLALIFGVPLVALVLFGYCIVRGLRSARQGRSMLGSASQQCVADAAQAQARTSLMMLVIVLVFIACNTLAFVLNAVEAFFGEHLDETQLRIDLFLLFIDVNNLLVQINSSVNGVIYFCFSRQFNSAVRCMLRHLADVCRSRSASDASVPEEEVASATHPNGNNSLLRRNGSCRDNRNRKATAAFTKYPLVLQNGSGTRAQENVELRLNVQKD